jgi:hypothetical protein
VPEFTHHEFAAIGRVVIETARLEATVRRAIWAALGLEGGQGRIVTACMERPEQLHALRALGGRFFQWRELDDFLGLVALIDALLKERDFILRAQWGFMMRDVFAVAGSWLDNDEGDGTQSPNFPFKRVDGIVQEARLYRTQLGTWIHGLVRTTR